MAHRNSKLTPSGRLLLVRRVEAGWSAARVAEAVGVSRATVQWRGGVELSIFMQPDATPAQSDATERLLSQMPEVKKVTYVGQDAAYDEFKRMFANEPDMVESVTAKDLPPSYRVVPRKAEFVDTIGARYHLRASLPARS